MAKTKKAKNRDKIPKLKKTDKLYALRQSLGQQRRETVAFYLKPKFVGIAALFDDAGRDYYLN